MITHHHDAMTHSTSDPWAYRSEGMRCKSCMWFAPKYPDGQPKYDGDRITLPPVNMGRCRRHAPTMNGYPVVFVNDWCGDHKLNENRVASVDMPGHEPERADVRLDELNKELQQCQSAFQELRRENETLSRALDRMTDRAASLAGIKREAALRRRLGLAGVPEVQP